MEINGEAWLVGKDVAAALGYTNPQKAIRDHVDNEDTTVNDSFTVNGTKIILINESGLYSLVLSSKLPDAKKYHRWVTSEVLPAIRKHGTYMTPETIQEVLFNPDAIITIGPIHFVLYSFSLGPSLYWILMRSYTFLIGKYS